jgi:hypothetical protein
MKNLFLLIFTLSVVTSCVQVREVKDVVTLTQNVQRIAVLPLKTTLEHKIWMKEDKYQDLCHEKSEQLQAKLIKQLEFYQRSGKLPAEIMPADEVNALLFGANYPKTPLNDIELCQLLHVDAILIGDISILEPVSEGAAIAINSLSNGNVSAMTNYVQMTLRLATATQTQSIWSASTASSGYLGSNKHFMVNRVIRRVVRNMPYNLRKPRYKKALKG